MPKANNAFTRPTIAIKGRGKADRERAFADIATNAYTISQSMEAQSAIVAKALGKAPTTVELAFAKQLQTAGRAAGRLPDSEFPKNCKSIEARIDYVWDQMLNYCAPTVVDVPTSKHGRRSPLMHKAIRAGEQWWSLIAGDLGHGKSQGATGKNNGRKKGANNKRNSGGAGGGAGGGVGNDNSTPPNHGELVKPDAPMTVADIVNHYATQSTALGHYGKKYAALLPAELGAMIERFRKDVHAFASEWQLEQDAKDAIKAEKEKTKLK